MTAEDINITVSITDDALIEHDEYGYKRAYELTNLPWQLGAMIRYLAKHFGIEF